MTSTRGKVLLAAVGVLGVLGVLALPLRSLADEPKRVTIGLYAPSAPFESPEQRLGFVTELAEHMQAKTGRTVVGRVFSRAADLTAAVKKGEVQFVVVDAPSAAISGIAYDVIGAAVRGKATAAAWELVAATSIRGVTGLRGKTVVVPTAAGRESQFVLNVLFEGELPPGFFAKVSSSPDALSAVAAVGLGRADAAVVPGGLTLPSGTHRVVTLRDVGWPMFAAAPGVDTGLRAAFAGALASFRSSHTFTGFEAPAGADYAGLAHAFGQATRRGPLAVPPPARLEVKGVLAGRSFVIAPSDLKGLVQAPAGPRGESRPAKKEK